MQEAAYMILEYAGGGDLKTQLDDRIARKNKKDTAVRYFYTFH